MQDVSEENKKENRKLMDLIHEDKHNLVSFFVLLMKVDKRINPALYQIKKQK